MADGTILVARRHDPTGKPRAVALLVPDLGEDLTQVDGAAALLAQRGIRAFAVSLRGHGSSGGRWTLAGHLRDHRAWIATLSHRERGSVSLPLLIIARGLSASVALLHEEVTHRHHASHIPPLPDGMLLLDPIARGASRVPRGLAAALSRRHGACNFLSREQRGVLRRFTLPPVRVQTPTILYASGPLHSEDPDDPLRRVFGNARVRRATWLHPTTRVQHLRADHEIARACVELLTADRPHRFRADRRAP